MKTTTCPKCNYSFVNKGGNANRHIKVCDGAYVPYTPLTACSYCNLTLSSFTASEKANHTRWCKENPKSTEYRSDASKRIKESRTGSTPPQDTKEKIRQAHLNGRYSHINRSEWWLGKTHSDETKEKLRQKALASPHRRLKKKTIEYKGVLLDSSWELELAKRLDNIGVTWTRPDPITWVDKEDVTHHYFPDFFLPDYNIYLDPKNPQAVKAQQEKLGMLLKQHLNVRILYSLEECKNFEI